LPIKNFIGWQLGKIFYLFFPQSVHYQESPSIIHQTASTHYFRREQKKNFEPFQFLQSEDNIGYSWLKSYGWNINQPFLCVIARDDAYDITRLKSNKISEVKYRNLAISNFGLAVDWLASQGIWIIRMGSIVNSKFDFYNQKLIDYPFDKNKSDFLDIWLLSKCNGIISTGTGPDVLGILNNIPILHVGLSPLISMCSFAQTITLPKKLFDSSNQKYLNLTKTLDLSWDSRNLPRYHKFASDFNYINWGVKVIDPEPLEILSAVKEFWQRLNNVWVESEEDIELQTKFWSIFSSHPFYKINHGWKHPHAYLGASWLKSMGYEFLT
jgi:putative glycosyltransferase (TIGR04372 family)